MENHSTYFLHCYVPGLQYYEVSEVWKKLEIMGGIILDFEGILQINK